jgi:integrase/recombinase XerD
MPASIPALPALCQDVVTDDELVRLWVATKKSRHTRRAYEADAQAFRQFVGTPLRSVRLRDVLAFAASLTDLADATAARRLSAVKSLMGFGHRTGNLPYDTAAPLPLPNIKDQLGERILTEWQVQRMLELERHPRNAAILRTLYLTGARISELCALHWRDLTARPEGGQATILGKGGKTRHVLLPKGLWARLAALRGTAGPTDPVFRSRQGGTLDPSSVHSIVKEAARRAKLPSEVSAHWLRHSHASHSLDRNCPVHVLQATLGHSSLQTTTKYAHVRPDDSSSSYLPE